MTDQRAINVISVETLCDLYGTDGTQFDLGTLALVRQEGVYFSIVDSGGAPGPDLISTSNGPAQPGCSNPNVPVGTSPRRWARTSLTVAEAARGNAPAYYVNAVTGDDSLDGLTPPTAVEHVAEVCRRMRGASYNTVPIHIYCLTPIPASDTLFFERNLTPGMPIIVHSYLDAPAPYKPAPLASFALTAVQALDPATNSEETVSAPVIGALSVATLLVLSPLSSNPGAFGWTALSLKPDEQRTTPFGTQSGTSPSIVLQDPVPGDVADTFVMSGLPVGSLRLDVDPQAEVWLKGFVLQHGVDTAPQKLVSGRLRLVECTGMIGDAADFQLFGDTSLFFDGCHTQDLSGAAPGTGIFEGQTTFFAGDAPLAKTRFIYGHSMVDPNATISVAAQENVGLDSCLTEFEDLCIVDQASPLGAVAGDLGGSMTFTGFLYGDGVTTFAATLDHYSEAAYQAVLVPNPNPTFVADGGGGPGSALVQFPRSLGPAVTKTLTAADLPFVSNTTAVDSQSGMIAAS